MKIKKGKLYIETYEEQEILETVCRGYVSNRKFLDSIGFDYTNQMPSSVHSMYFHIKGGRIGLTQEQWKKVEEQYKEITSSQSNRLTKKNQ